jgi:hypothetical protein
MTRSARSNTAVALTKAAPRLPHLMRGAIQMEGGVKPNLINVTVHG